MEASDGNDGPMWASSPTDRNLRSKFRSEIAFGGEILLRRVKCFAAQNAKYFIFDEMLWTGFARTHYNCRLQAAKHSGNAGIHHVFAHRKHIMCDSTHHFAKQNIISGVSPTSSALRKRSQTKIDCRTEKSAAAVLLFL